MVTNMVTMKMEGMAGSTSKVEFDGATCSGGTGTLYNLEYWRGLVVKKTGALGRDRSW